jgi:hypothetical protein
MVHFPKDSHDRTAMTELPVHGSQHSRGRTISTVMTWRAEGRAGEHSQNRITGTGHAQKRRARKWSYEYFSSVQVQLIRIRTKFQMLVSILGQFNQGPANRRTL